MIFSCIFIFLYFTVIYIVSSLLINISIVSSLELLSWAIICTVAVSMLICTLCLCVSVCVRINSQKLYLG